MAYCPPRTFELLPALAVRPGLWWRFEQWFVAARGNRVICFVMCIWLLNAFDLAFTLLSHQSGMLYEQNPLARQVLRLGPLSVMLYKLGLVAIGTYPLLKYRKFRISEMAAIIVVFVYSMLAIRWANCYHFYSMAFPYRMNMTASMDETWYYMP